MRTPRSYKGLTWQEQLKTGEIDWFWDALVEDQEFKIFVDNHIRYTEALKVIQLHLDEIEKLLETSGIGTENGLAVNQNEERLNSITAIIVNWFKDGNDDYEVADIYLKLSEYSKKAKILSQNIGLILDGVYQANDKAGRTIPKIGIYDK